MLAFLYGGHWSFSTLAFTFLAFGTCRQFHVPVPRDGMRKGQEIYLLGALAWSRELRVPFGSLVPGHPTDLPPWAKTAGP